MTNQPFSICIVGGTGAEGSGLALRWAHAGHKVTIGSRDERKAKETARELNAILGADRLSGTESRKGVAAADIVVLTVPFAAQIATVSGLQDELAGKILIDVTVPLVPPKVSRVQLPPTDSCVVAVQQMLGEKVRVVSAFQNVSAHKLKNLEHRIDCDVFVTSDDKEARAIGIVLAEAAGLRGIDAGPLANSVVAESLTSLLIWINRTYKIPDAGIRITGLSSGGIIGGTMTFGDLLLRPLRGIPPVAAGDDLADIALAGLQESDERLREGDVLVFAQKIVSKAEGRTVDLASVVPSTRALKLAERNGQGRAAGGAYLKGIERSVAPSPGSSDRGAQARIYSCQCGDRPLQCGRQRPRSVATGRSRCLGRAHP